MYIIKKGKKTWQKIDKIDLIHEAPIIASVGSISEMDMPHIGSSNHSYRWAISHEDINTAIKYSGSARWLEEAKSKTEVALRKLGKL